MSERTREIVHARLAGLKREQQSRVGFGYEVKRGLTYESSQQGESPLKGLGYTQLLPLIDGENVIQIIESRAQTGQKVKIMDVGCGRGRFLIDCKIKWGDKVECTGVTAFPYHQATTQEELQRLAIAIEIADAQSLPRNFAGEKFDIVVSTYTAIHVTDALAMLKGIYWILKPDGVALIHRFPIWTVEGDKKFMQLLEDQYAVHFSETPRGGGVDIAFRKNAPRLSLPVVYSHIEHHVDDFKRVIYRLKD